MTTAPGPAGLSASGRHTLRVVAVAAYAAVLAAWTWQVGFPTGRIQIFVWAWTATIAWRVDRTPREHLGFLRDWWVPVAVMLFYVYSRAIADDLGTPVHWRWPIGADSWLGAGELPSQRLQGAICGSDCGVSRTATLVDTLCTTVYASHFVVAWVIAVVLWLRRREDWVAWMRRLLPLNVVGVVAAILVPMAPPWLASAEGYVDPPVERMTGRGWSELGLHFSQLIMGPLANQVAAMPSLHTATAALVAFYAIQKLTTPWRWLSLLYLGAMCFTLVYLGEHYVVDELAGIALAAVVLLVASWWERRRSSSASSPDCRRALLTSRT